MLEWRFHKADWYVWMDSSVRIKDGIDLPQAILDTAKGNPLCLFKHTRLNSIREEATLVKQKMRDGVQYFQDRFEGEPILTQVKHYLSDPTFNDNKLFQMTFFAYHCSARTLMQEWFLENCIWSIKDQLSFPYVLHKSGLNYSLFEGNALDNQLFEWDITSREKQKGIHLTFSKDA